MVSYNGKEVRKNGLYPNKVLKVEYVDVAQSNTKVGIAVVVKYNKIANSLAMNFAQLMVAKQNPTSDGAGTWVKWDSTIPDRMDEKNIDKFAEVWKTLGKNKDAIFNKWKTDNKVVYKPTREERKALLEEKGFEFASNEDAEE